jgi:hypothetical protein
MHRHRPHLTHGLFRNHLQSRLAIATASAENPALFRGRINQMKNPLDSLWGTVISGLVLTVVVFFAIKMILGG